MDIYIIYTGEILLIIIFYLLHLFVYQSHTHTSALIALGLLGDLIGDVECVDDEDR